jgi:hypothetical protein
LALPITALREGAPSAAAIQDALLPSSANFLSVFDSLLCPHPLIPLPFSRLCNLSIDCPCPLSKRRPLDRIHPARRICLQLFTIQSIPPGRHVTQMEAALDCRCNEVELNTALSHVRPLIGKTELVRGSFPAFDHAV